MQKNRKLLSVLLAMVMMLSVISAGLVAAAQEAKASKDAVVTALEKKINAFEGKAEDNKAGYDALVADFQKLGDSQKDSIDVFALNKLTQLMYAYEQTQATGNSTAKRKAAAKKVVETLNSPALNAAQKAVDDGISDTKKTADQIADIYKAMPSTLSKLMASTAFSTYGLFYYNLESKGNYVIYSITNKIFTDVKKEQPYSGIARPNSKDYPDGSKNPDYIKDYREYYTQNYTWEINCVKEAIKRAVAKIGDNSFNAILTFIDKAVPAIDAFKTSNDWSKADDVVNYYNSLDVEVQLSIAAISFKGYITYADKPADTATSPTTIFVSALYKELDTIAKYQTVNEFDNFMATVDKPYTIEKYESAHAKYDAVPSTLRSKLNEEGTAKYRAICQWKAIQDLKSTDKPDMSGYKKTNVTYPSGAPYEKTTDAIPKMDELVNKIVELASEKDLRATVNGIYTNEALTKIAATFFPKLDEIVVSLEGTIKELAGPDYASMISLKKDLSVKAYRDDIADIEAYAGAVQALDNVLATGNGTWADVKFKNGDFFVESGDPAKDKEAFLDAFATMFRPVGSIALNAVIINVPLFKILDLENVFDLGTETYREGNYEKLHCIFEALGIESVDSVTYTDAVNAAETDNEKIDARIRPILETVFTLLDNIAVAPVTTLTELLPNLAAVLNSGYLNVKVQEIVDNAMNGLGSLVKGIVEDAVGGPVNLVNLGIDLSTENLFNTLGKLGIEGITFTESTNTSGDVNYPNQGTLTVTIALQEAGTDESGNTTEAKYTTIALQEKDFIEVMKDLEGCGTLKVYESDSIANAYKARVEADKADAFVTLMRYVYDDVLIPNRSLVNDIISAKNPDNADTINSILSPVLDVIAGALPSDAFITAIVNVADPQVPDINIGGGEEGGIAGFIQKLIDLIMSFFNPEDPTNPDNPDNPGNNDNPSIPNTTSGKIIAPIVVMAVLGGIGAGAAACVNKCKKDDEE